MIRWDPLPMIVRIASEVGLDEDPVVLRQKIHTWSLEWDKGRSDEGVAVTAFAEPRYAGFIQAYHDHWAEGIQGVVPEMVELLEELKQRGYKLYIASNWASDKFEEVRHMLSFFGLFDGGLVSGFAGVSKPHPEFFQKLLKDFNLKKEQCLFIDDVADNIDAARSFGIESILFETPLHLRDVLNNKGFLS